MFQEGCSLVQNYYWKQISEKGRMALSVKALVTTPVNLCSIPRSHIHGQGREMTPLTFYWTMVCVCMHAYNKKKKLNENKKGKQKKISEDTVPGTMKRKVWRENCNWHPSCWINLRDLGYHCMCWFRDSWRLPGKQCWQEPASRNGLRLRMTSMWSFFQADWQERDKITVPRKWEAVVNIK